MLSQKSLQDRISLMFYHHGLLCASHPFAIISLVITSVMFMCYPLINLPLPGNAPLQFETPVDGYEIPAAHVRVGLSDETEMKRPRWYFGPPVAYVQQIVIKAAIVPWEIEKLIPSDAYRATLSTVFDVIEHVDNYQQRNGSKIVSMSDICLRVSEVVGEKKSVDIDGLLPLLPEYNCLQLSPARLWYQDKQRFLADGEILNTVYKKHAALSSVKDVLFGVPWQNSGLKKYYYRNKQRVVSYAVTLVYKKYDHSFVEGLRNHLLEKYPTSSVIPSNATHSVSHLVHIHYRSHNYIVEYTPLIVAYVVLCLYLYFSVRKIEMVKSKWGLAFSAMVTVFASLLMSVSLCVFFGLQPSLSGSEIFPYLVIFIGLENILVVTKSVVSTPVHLDVKIRVAQGLQKEGWYMFRHLMMELLLIFIGFFTFVPAIQEFCLFALFGVGSDFFLHMFFFTTVLSIDIRRMELTDLQRPDIREAMRRDSSTEVRISTRNASLSNRCPQIGTLNAVEPLPNGSVAPLTGIRRLTPAVERRDDADAGIYSYDYVGAADEDDEVFPTRMRAQWAQYRIIQRFIMFCVVIWIVLIVYKTGLVEDPDNVSSTQLQQTAGDVNSSSKIVSHDQMKELNWATRDAKDLFADSSGNLLSEYSSLLVHDNAEQWKSLLPNHWKTIFIYYNISLLGRYLTVLPSVHLSIPVSVDDAIALRHPAELQSALPYIQQGLWQESFQDGTRRRVMPSEENGMHGDDGHTESNQSSPLDMVFQRLVRYPKTRVEFVLTIILGISSAILWLYMILNLYKCLCSRNYDKWRSSWIGKRRVRRVGYYTAFRESVPLVLSGHRQEVECIMCDGPNIVSSCLGGEIRIWDIATGECRMAIDRTQFAESMAGALRQRTNSDSISSDSDCGSTTPHLVDPHHSVFTPAAKISCSTNGLNVPEFEWPTGRGSSTGQCSSIGNLSSSSLSPLLKNQKGSSSRVGSGHARHRSVDYALASIIPDLTDTIDTDFTNQSSSSGLQQSRCGSEKSDANVSTVTSDDIPKQLPCHSNGYDFTQFQSYFDEHRKLQREGLLHSVRRRGPTSTPSAGASIEDSVFTAPSSRYSNRRKMSERKRLQSTGFGELLAAKQLLPESSVFASAIWSLNCRDNLVIAGCGNGAVEFWDMVTGQLKYRYQQHKAGVIAVCLQGNRLVVAHVNGILEFLQWESSARPPCSSNNDRPSSFADNGPCSSSVIASSNRSSQGSTLETSQGHMMSHASNKPLVVLMSSVRAHQRPINAVRVHGDRIVTASCDHTLKVYRVDNGVCLHTFHGHTGSVSALCLEVFGSALVATSGSDDSSVRVWDIQSGACLHKLTGHDSMVTSVAAAVASSHIVSVATDDRLCIWDYVSGDLLHCLQMEPGYCNAVAMLTKQLAVTGGQGFIHVWDVATGVLVRAVTLSEFDSSIFVRQLHVTAGNSVLVCDYGPQLRVVRFTSVLEKDD